ncbi:cocaine esterase [Fusarium napiforme]|uniref:Cocaine esterase n=1 Tax=Fusarium napiforme TaxID=42672 RepID=A0A8H5JJ74_9HYPO|nr:cocaine esterase [Fusarium napiforme]
MVASTQLSAVKPQKIQELFPDAIISKITPAPDHPHFNYDDFKPGRRVLQAGHVRYPGRRPFGVPTIYERDQAITVRDGARLYADIFRPETSDTQPVPCILPWSLYGKTGTGLQNYDFMAPYRATIPLDRISGYKKLEAPDPAKWAKRGYAILNIDARGPKGIENVIAILEKHPLYNNYWQAKRIPVKNIDNIPISFQTFRQAKTEKKWLRVHPYQEWYDVATELAGYPKAVLYMSCPDHDDFDVAVQIRKIDDKGRQFSHLNYPCPVPIDEVPDVNTAKTLGPQGFIRASHHISLDREGGPVVSDDLSRDTDVLYSHRIRQPISPGTIVRLEIPIWPIGMVFAAGEGIALNVSGHDMYLPETDLCRLREPEDENVGRHYVHTGGKYDSHLIIPVIMG